MTMYHRKQLYSSENSLYIVLNTMSQMFLVEPYIEPEYPITQRSGETKSSI